MLQMLLALRPDFTPRTAMQILLAFYKLAPCWIRGDSVACKFTANTILYIVMPNPNRILLQADIQCNLPAAII